MAFKANISNRQGRNLSDNWGGGVYSHIRVIPDEFLLKSTKIPW